MKYIEMKDLEKIGQLLVHDDAGHVMQGLELLRSMGPAAYKAYIKATGWCGYLRLRSMGVDVGDMAKEVGVAMPDGEGFWARGNSWVAMESLPYPNGPVGGAVWLGVIDGDWENYSDALFGYVTEEMEKEGEHNCGSLYIEEMDHLPDPRLWGMRDPGSGGEQITFDFDRIRGEIGIEKFMEAVSVDCLFVHGIQIKPVILECWLRSGLSGCLSISQLEEG